MTRILLSGYIRRGDLILCRIPGLHGRLSESWEGPYEVVDKLSCVNYRVRQLQSKSKGKVVHVNATKRYRDRVEDVRRLTVLADEPAPQVGLEAK